MVKESRDRILKENNLIVFNVTDSMYLNSFVVNEILRELSNPILASNAKRLGKPGNTSRPRPILAQFN